MVEVKFSLRKRDFVWFGLFVVLIGFGTVYGYGSMVGPSVLGHTWGEINFNDDFCRYVTGDDCVGDVACNPDSWTPEPGYTCTVDQTNDCGDTRTISGTKVCSGSSAPDLSGLTFQISDDNIWPTGGDLNGKVSIRIYGITGNPTSCTWGGVPITCDGFIYQPTWPADFGYTKEAHEFVASNAAGSTRVKGASIGYCNDDEVWVRWVGFSSSHVSDLTRVYC
jgi:hypothetical protein